MRPPHPSPAHGVYSHRYTHITVGLDRHRAIFVDRLLAEYNLHLYDHRGTTRFSFFRGLLLCAGLELLAAVCAAMAAYRETNW